MLLNVLLVKLEITSIYIYKLGQRQLLNWRPENFNLVKSLWNDDALGAFFTADGNWFPKPEIMQAYEPSRNLLLYEVCTTFRPLLLRLHGVTRGLNKLATQPEPFSLKHLKNIIKDCAISLCCNVFMSTILRIDLFTDTAAILNSIVSNSYYECSGGKHILICPHKNYLKQ